MTRVLPRFPTAVRGINALSATTQNGVLEVGIDPTNLAQSADPTAPGNYTFILKSTTNEFELAEVASTIVDIATKDEAEAGTDNTAVLTPLRTAQAISASESPFKYNAAGDGSALDLAAFQAAESAFSAVRLPEGAIFNLGATPPAKPVYGPGAVKIGGVVFGSNQPVVDIYRSSMFMTPGDYASTVGFPTGDLKQNIVFSVGSKAQQATALNRSTVFGGRNLTVVGATLDRVEAFGDGAGRMMKWGQRSTLLGSIAGEQLGTQDISQHTAWFDAGGFTPGQPGWDYQGLETDNPGIGAKMLAASMNLASSMDDVAAITGIGRDAFNGTIKGVDSVAVGYRALAGSFVTYRNTAVGVDSLRRGIFVTQATGLGYRNLLSWQEGDSLLGVGHNTFLNTIRGDNVIGVGFGVGSGIADVSNSILIGRNVLNDGGYTSLSDVFAMAMTSGNPLLSGKFDTGFMGINILPEKLKGRLHIRTSDFGTEAAVNATGDELVLESSGHTGMTVRSGATSLGSVYFDRSGATAAGYVQYNHSTGTMLLRGESESTLQVGSTKRVQANGTGIGFNGSAPVARSIYGAPTGTATRTTFATSTVTLPDLAERVKALIDDLRSCGLAG
jgi:hypothetical protein